MSAWNASFARPVQLKLARFFFLLFAVEHQNSFSKPWNCYDSLRLCKDTQGQWSPVKMSDWMLHLIPRGKGSMRVQQETAFFTDTRLRRNWVSLWAVFDSWAVGTAHTGFVGTLWRIGEAEPKINSLVLDCDLLTSKWSHKIAHRHCTLPGLFKTVGSTKGTPSHSCLHALAGGTMRCCIAIVAEGRDQGRNGLELQSRSK